MYSSGTWQLQCMSAAGQTVTNFHLLFSPVPFRYGYGREPGAEASSPAPEILRR